MYRLNRLKDIYDDTLNKILSVSFEFTDLYSDYMVYNADKLKVNLSAYGNTTNVEIFEIDIKSAFPKICNILYPNTKFITQLNTLDDKLERNILLSNTLIKWKEESGFDHLKQLNAISKLIILGYCANNYSINTIFEFKKDGVIFSGTKIDPINDEFNNILLEIFNLQSYVDLFHCADVLMYIRMYNLKTSIYIYKDNVQNVIFKGMLKKIPDKLYPILIRDIIIRRNVMSLKYLKEYYMEDFLNMSLALGATNVLDDYYLFGNKIFTGYNRLETINNAQNQRSVYYKNDFDPFYTLCSFIYPIITMFKR